MSTTDDSIICTINKSQPSYQPNIYICHSNSHCCTYLGEPVCCYSDISFSDVLLQAWPIMALFLCFLLFAALVSWYFSDEDECYDYEEEGAEKRTMIGILFPSDEDDKVDDPLFGPLYRENVPRKAYVSPSEENANELLPTPRPILDEC